MAGSGKKKRRAPASMGTRALKFWHLMTDKYEFREDELRLLEDACREMTLIDTMDRALRNNGLVQTGSQGQVVANPLLREVRQHRAVLNRLLDSLQIPDEPGDGRAEAAAEVRSINARNAAKSRWAVHHGEAV